MGKYCSHLSSLPADLTFPLGGYSQQLTYLFSVPLCRYKPVQISILIAPFPTQNAMQDIHYSTLEFFIFFFFIDREPFLVFLELNGSLPCGLTQFIDPVSQLWELGCLLTNMLQQISSEYPSFCLYVFKCIGSIPRRGVNALVILIKLHYIPVRLANRVRGHHLNVDTTFTTYSTKFFC